MQKRVRVDGERSRAKILAAAVRLATTDGIERLSLARLADAADMSKSGVFGLFGSKLELQLATIDAAQAIFVSEVVEPAMGHPEGRERLVALCDGFLDALAGREWPEGCFFASVAAEVGARDGPIRDRVAAGHDRWIGLLAANARHAVGTGELPDATGPDRLAFELATMLTGVDVAYLLHRDPEILGLARQAIRDRLV